jgi:serine protease Do
LLIVLSILVPTVGRAATGGSNSRETPIVRAVRRVQPAVVNISSEKTVGSRGWSSDYSEPQRVNGMGTGVIIDPRGYVITNAHVVDRVNSVRVRLADGTACDATTVSVDKTTDLAVLKIEAGRSLPALCLGSSNDLMIGEPVIAVGNAFGYENTVTDGIISQLGRTVKLNDELTYYDLIQTNASINPGNSGGPLLNINGDLIGINVAIRAGAQNIGFAIPADTVRRVVADLISIRRLHGTVHGVSYQDLVPTGEKPELSLQVARAEGAGAKAGLRAGDRVIRVGQTPVNCGIDFERALLDARSGQPNPVVVLRDGKEHTLQLVLDGPPETPSEIVWRRLGLRLSVIDPSQVRRFRSDLRGGLYVAEIQPSSPATRADIQVGDVLLGLYPWATLSYDDVMYVLNRPELTKLQPVILRGGRMHQTELALPADHARVASGQRR